MLPEAEWRRAISRGERTRPDMLIATVDDPSLLELAVESDLPVWCFAAEGGGTGTLLEGLEPVASLEPVSRVRLLAIDPSTGVAHPWRTAEGRTHPTSPNINRATMIQLSLRAFSDALLTLRQLGLQETLRQAFANPGMFRPAAAQPQPQHALKMFCRALVTGAGSRLRHAPTQVEWSIAVGKAADNDWRTGRFADLEWMELGGDRFFADPCLVQHGDRTWLFMEELRYAEGKGTISVMDAADIQAWKEAERVLVQPFHLSFPHVFDFEGEFFMVPEQLQSGCLVLYRSHRFPYDWRPHVTLLEDVSAADPVLLCRDGHWWLFFSRGDHGSHDNNLQLYYADRLEGPYRRHPQSPVRENLLGSRMAGPMFEENGQLIRPSQDCRLRYGAALSFYEVDSLDPQQYCERWRSRAAPDSESPFGQGMHSFCRAGSLVAVDGFRYLARRTLNPKRSK